MKRRWNTMGLIVGLILLLVSLGALQYRWQAEISENQREKLQKDVGEAAARFADDFDREIQGAYFNFQIGAEGWRTRNYQAFAERYNFWLSKTAYVGLIRDFYFFDANGQSDPLKFDKESRTFATVDWTDELRTLYSRSADSENFHPVLPEVYTLVLPEHESPPRVAHVVLRSAEPTELTLKRQMPDKMSMPKTFGYLAIVLDSAVIKDQLLPDLATKYFGDGEFDMSISDRTGIGIYQTAAVTNADARVGMFELSPKDIFFFANKDLAESIGERRESVILDSHIESRTMSRSDVPGEGGTVKVEIQSSSSPQTKIFSTKVDGVEPWMLTVQHSAGSIDVFISNSKIKNLAIGWGILAFLGLAVTAIIYSAQRARNFAQRQVDFVSSVSHEFRTPLAVICSAGENLADGISNEVGQVSRYGELIKGEGKKLSAMVEQILEFAGANSGKRKYKLDPIDPDALIRRAVAECCSLIDEQHIDLEIDVGGDLPNIVGDEDSLTSALQNLIANAVKYRNGRGWVRVSAHNGDGTVKFSVEDHGIGISKSDLSHVFEPFFRSKAVVDAQIHGNGLGLALVKQIAEGHGGRVLADSEPGRGSKFTIELPAA